MATTTLTKPILLDETGQAINQTLDNMQESLDGMEETMLRNLEIAYTDIHSEADGYLSSMAESLATIAENGGGGGGGSVTPVSIAITTPPTKTYYVEGITLDADQIDLTGIAVTATYSNGTLKNVTNQCTFSPENGAYATRDMTSIKATWTWGDLTFRASYDITVVYVSEYAITPPTKTQYVIGEPLDLTGLAVNAVFSDNTLRVMTDWTCSPEEGTLHSPGDYTLDIRGDDPYTHHSFRDNTSITVTYRNEYKPVGIEVIVRPTKTSYKQGQALDLTGMRVAFNKPDYTSEVVTGWTTSPADGTTLSTLGENTITVSWTDPDTSTTYTTTTTVNVNEKALSSITITTPPTKTIYNEGELLDSTEIVVTANFDNGTTQDITNVCTITPVDGTTVVHDSRDRWDVEWTYGDVTKTVHPSYTVIYCYSIEVTTRPTKGIYVTGESLDLTGLVVTGHFYDEHSVPITRDVTSICTYSPANGTVLSNAGAEAITVNYPYRGISTTFNVTVQSEPIYSWETGSDEQIAAMLARHYDPNDDFDITEVWSVGEQRIVRMNPMTATNVSEAYPELYVMLVLSNVGGKVLADGVTECAFQVDQQNYFSKNTSENKRGYSLKMNTSDTNAGGWKDSAGRTWCNNSYYNALPSTLKPIFKQFKNMTGKGGSDMTTEETVDYFALRSASEILGYQSQYDNCSTAEGEGNQVEWFETSSNRRRKPVVIDDGELDYTNYSMLCWSRSPAYNHTSAYSHVDNGEGFCDVAQSISGDDGVTPVKASTSEYMCPFGVI